MPNPRMRRHGRFRGRWIHDPRRHDPRYPTSWTWGPHPGSARAPGDAVQAVCGQAQPAGDRPDDERPSRRPSRSRGRSARPGAADFRTRGRHRHRVSRPGLAHQSGPERGRSEPRAPERAWRTQPGAPERAWRAQPGAREQAGEPADPSPGLRPAHSTRAPRGPAAWPLLSWAPDPRRPPEPRQVPVPPPPPPPPHSPPRWPQRRRAGRTSDTRPRKGRRAAPGRPGSARERTDLGSRTRDRPRHRG